LRHRRQAFADPEIEVVERRRPELDQHLAVARLGIRSVLVDEHLGAAVLVDAYRLHGHNPLMTAEELRRLGDEVDLDVVGATPATAYEETERHIRERRARGLFADMRFTMARPEESCHPETLLELDCGWCRLCIDACPTGALDEPGTLDANRCLSYWTQAPAPIPPEYRAELGPMVYGCDVCQDVCPWNRGVERRRAGTPAAEANVSLVGWLEGDERGLSSRYDRLYVPRNDGRWLQ